MNNKHIIWSNMNLNIEDWKDELTESWLINHDNEPTEEELYECMVDTNAMYLEDERVNLDIQLSQPILIIAELGLWNGKHDAYKEILSGNIKDCLSSDTDYTEWYVDAYGNLRATASHHDGTNTYLYRVWKDTASESQRENLKVKILSGDYAPGDLTRLTKRIGTDIAEVYGWNIKGAKKKGDK